MHYKMDGTAVDMVIPMMHEKSGIALHNAEKLKTNLKM